MIDRVRRMENMVAGDIQRPTSLRVQTDPRVSYSSRLMSTALRPRSRRQPEARPTQIVDAALEVFAEHGLAAARIEDIAKRAGLSKGTIYLYFPTKEALFREVIRQTVVSQIELGERDFEHATTSATESLE